MSEESYKVTVSGAGLTLERDVPAHVGEQVVVLVLTGKAGRTNQSTVLDMNPPSPPEGGNSGSGDEAPARMSIREYLDDREAKRNPDKITAIGCYLKDQGGKASFNRIDLEAMFQAAAEAVPKNLARDLKWATRVGWIALMPNERGTYYVTAKGMEAVRKKFPKELIKKTAQGTRKTRRLASKQAEE